MYEDNNQYQNYNSMPYDNTSAGNASYSGGTPAAPQPGEPENGKKGGSPVLKKLGVSAACALVFGAVAGVTMNGITGGAARNAAPQAVESTAAAEGSAAAAESTAAAGNTNEAESTAAAKAENGAAQSATASAAAETSAAAQNGYVMLDVSGIVEKAMPSVVSIDVLGEQSFSDWFGRRQTYETKGAGSGILIGENDTEYLVVTNDHVVENTTKVTVQFIDEEVVEAEVKGTDSGKDVAVIAVRKEDVKPETRQKIVVAEMGDSDSLKVGQGVIAIGNALGYGQSVTVGYVSALNRSITAADSTGRMTTVENLLQTDAAINPGNSGGALLDMNGRVIGINESKSVDTSVEGMGYAIPISTVKNLIETLSTQKAQVPEEKRGYIGFQGQNVDDDAAARFNMPEGIFVYKILEDGAAAHSELQENDIITKLNGMTVQTIEELKEKLTRYEIGETVTLTVQRPDGKEYKEIEIEVKLAPQGTVAGQKKAENQAENPDQSGNGNGNSGSEGSGNGSEGSGSGSGDNGAGNGGQNNGGSWNNGGFDIDDFDQFFRDGGFQFRW